MSEELAKMLKQSSQAVINAQAAILDYSVESAKSGKVNEELKAGLVQTLTDSCEALETLKKALQ